MKSKIKKLTLIVSGVFIVLTAAFGLYFYQNPDIAKEVLSAYLPQAQSVMNEDGSISYIGIVLNNLFACVMCIGFGFIPFLFLPAWSVVSNAMIIGALLGLGSAAGTMSPTKAILFGLLPHGIFELPAFFLSMAMGLYLCRTLSMKLFAKAREEKILTTLNGIAKTFVLVIMPLIIVAAVVECIITPAVMNAAGLN